MLRTVGEESGPPMEEDSEASMAAGDCSKQLCVSSVTIPVMVVFSTSSSVYMWILPTTSTNSLSPWRKHKSWSAHWSTCQLIKEAENSVTPHWKFSAVFFRCFLNSKSSFWGQPKLIHNHKHRNQQAQTKHLQFAEVLLMQKTSILCFYIIIWAWIGVKRMKSADCRDGITHQKSTNQMLTNYKRAILCTEEW